MWAALNSGTQPEWVAQSSSICARGYSARLLLARCSTKGFRTPNLISEVVQGDSSTHVSVPLGPITPGFAT